jgi:hypothetical protein
MAPDAKKTRITIGKQFAFSLIDGGKTDPTQNRVDLLTL